MKKLLILAVAAFGMLLSASCSKDDDTATYGGTISYPLDSYESGNSEDIVKVLAKYKELGFIKGYDTISLIPSKTQFLVYPVSIEVSGVPASDTTRVKEEKKAELKKKLNESAAALNAVDWASLIGKDKVHRVNVGVSYLISDKEVINVTVNYRYPALPANSTYTRSDAKSVLQKFVYSGVADSLGHYLVKGTLDGIGERDFIGSYSRSGQFAIRNADTTSIGLYRFIFDFPDMTMDKINLNVQRIKSKLDTINVIYNRQK